MSLEKPGQIESLGVRENRLEKPLCTLALRHMCPQAERDTIIWQPCDLLCTVKRFHGRCLQKNIRTPVSLYSVESERSDQLSNIFRLLKEQNSSKENSLETLSI